MTPPNAGESTRAAGFCPTHWTVIAQCARADEWTSAARSELCRAYWTPVNRHLLREGYSKHDADDLTQGFFAYILSEPWIEKADKAKGRFRNFLIISLRRFVQRVSDKSTAEKRGGNVYHVPVEVLSAEGVALEVSLQDSQVAFDADWAAAMIEASLKRLQTEFERKGRAKDFLQLRQYLSALGDSKEYEQAAAKMESSAAAFKVAVHRFRKRFAEVLREELIRTVSTSSEAQDEYLHIQRALSAGVVTV